jgi:hypothetical protein
MAGFQLITPAPVTFQRVLTLQGGQCTFQYKCSLAIWIAPQVLVLAVPRYAAAWLNGA